MIGFPGKNASFANKSAWLPGSAAWGTAGAPGEERLTIHCQTGFPTNALIRISNQKPN